MYSNRTSSILLECCGRWADSLSRIKRQRATAAKTKTKVPRPIRNCSGPGNLATRAHIVEKPENRMAKTAAAQCCLTHSSSLPPVMSQMACSVPFRSSSLSSRGCVFDIAATILLPVRRNRTWLFTSRCSPPAPAPPRFPSSPRCRRRCVRRGPRPALVPLARCLRG